MALAYDPLRTRAVDLEKSLAKQACRQGTGSQFTAQVAGRLRLCSRQPQIQDSILPKGFAPGFGYARSAAMEALALVTSADAMRRLLPCMAERDLALRSCWLDFAVTVAVADLQIGKAPTALPWPELLRQARSSRDVRTITLMDRCYRTAKSMGATVGGKARRHAQYKLALLRRRKAFNAPLIPTVPRGCWRALRCYRLY